MNTRLDSILNSRPSFDSPHIHFLFHYINRRIHVRDLTLKGMATDDKKKKLESLRTTLSNLETQKTLATSEGNKRKVESIERMISRFQKDIDTLKKL